MAHARRENCASPEGRRGGLLRRWPVWGGAVLLAGVLAAPAQQMGLPAETNLFGDDLVRKLDPQANVVRFQTPDVGKPKAKVAGYEQALIFQDGRQLRGTLGELTKDEVTWKRPDASEPLRFARAEVRRIALTPDGANQDRLTQLRNQQNFSRQMMQILAQSVGQMLQDSMAAVAASNPGGVIRIPSAVQLGNVRIAAAMRELGIPGADDGKEKKVEVATATVKLPGGDWLHGEVTGADGETLEYKLADGSKLAVPQASVEWLYFNDRAVPAYGFSGGVLDMEGWPNRTGAGQRMEIANGALVVRDGRMIGRTIAAPLKRFEVAFEVPEDTPQGVRLWLQPFGPQTNAYSTGTVQFRFSKQGLERSIYTRKFERLVTPLPAGAAEQKGPVSYRVLYDWIDKHVVVLRNGEQLGDWKLVDEEDKDAKVQNGRDVSITGICFDADNELKLNSMRMQPWDGTVARVATVGGKVEAVGAEGIVFSGKKMKRETGTFLPLQKAQPSLMQADAMLVFGAQGEMSARELEIRDGRARAQTSFSPAIDLPATSLQTVVFPARPGPAEQVADTLVFQNGNEVRGTLLGATTEGVRWKMPGGQELSFQATQLAGVRLAPRPGTPVAAGPATVELRNGDRLGGEFTGLDGRQLQFRHPALGAVAIPRDRVWSLYPNPAFAVIDGGRDPASWASSRRTVRASQAKSTLAAWTTLDGHYILRKSGPGEGGDWPALSPQAEIPERFELRLEATDRNGNLVNFGVNLFSKDSRSSLQANFSYYNLSLSMMRTKIAPGGGRTSNSSYKNVSLRGKVPDAGSRVALRAFVDRKAGVATFYMNGAQVARVGKAVNEDMPGIGEVISIDPGQQEDTTAILADIWIGPWSGELPGEENKGTVALTNGDAAPGLPSKWQDGKFAVETEVGEFELPLEKVQFIEFGGALKPEKAPARIRTTDGAAVTVDALRWDGQEVTAHSAALGDLRLPATAVTELVFNPTPVKPPGLPQAADALADKAPAADGAATRKTQ
jgi:hypothetical protein